MSSAPFTGYKSSSEDRLLLDQRGVNGQEVKLLEGRSARLPAGWEFTDLQLGSNECFRVSASDLFYDCWDVSPQRAARNLVGPPPHWRSFQGPAFTEVRRELPAWHAGALLRPSAEKSRKARQEYGAAASKLFGSYRALAQEDHCAVDFAQQAHWNLLRTAGALQPQGTVLGGIAFPGSRLIEALRIDDHIVLSIERFGDRGRREQELLRQCTSKFVTQDEPLCWEVSLTETEEHSPLHHPLLWWSRFRVSQEPVVPSLRRFWSLGTRFICTDAL